ncbi:MAG: hypothetical protein ACPG5P_00050 [Saprospiraceae bacterium]
MNIPEYKQETDISDFDVKNKEKLFEYMESKNLIKINLVLESIKAKKRPATQVEKRYLNFVKARLGAEVGIEKFAEVNPKGSQLQKILSDEKLDDDYISFHYMNGDECLFMVDLLGSLVKNAINIEDFKAEAIQTESENELGGIYEKYAKKVRKYLAKEAKVYPNGWFAKLCGILKKIRVDRILYDHTNYDMANSSSVKEEFMFLTNLNSYGSVSMDIFQSDEPDLTAIFWLLPNIPTTFWGDTTPNFPKNPLSYKRVARYRIGDDGSWKSKKM